MACFIAYLVFSVINFFFIEGYVLRDEDERKKIIEAENLLMTGGHIELNKLESKVDKLFMKYKSDELSKGFKNPERNAAGMHFFKAKSIIENSKIFGFLRKMPKGAVLHVHNTASVSSEWVTQNISYMPGLLRCIDKQNISIFSFRRTKEHGCATDYVRVSEERLNSISSADYDRNFEKLINLYTPSPEIAYTSINIVWTKFQDMFATVSDMLDYIPAYQAFHWQMLKEMYDDNIMYGEVRIFFKELYDKNGRTFSCAHAVKELLKVIKEFRRQHPNFLGIKAIYTIHRNMETNILQTKLKAFKKLHALFPEFVIGFDFAGQEDIGIPLYRLKKFLKDFPPTVKYFFHAGETNWYGTDIDLNLLDAVLLSTTRIGHGYALIKHPEIWNIVKARDIALEVNPISNQVLHLVWDLRNHPASVLMSQNTPMVICNDDPGFWGARGLSYDYYYAIMSLAPNHAGLKTLKNLVWNSVRYSVMDERERNLAYAKLENAWTQFLEGVIKGSVF